MPFCSRCGLIGLALLAFAFTGCDSSNPGRDIELVAGTYALSDLRFQTAPGANQLSVDIADELGIGAIQLQIFNNEDGEAQLEVEDTQGRLLNLIRLRASPSRNQVRLEAVEDRDEDDLRELLLKPSFTLQHDGDPVSFVSGEVDWDNLDLSEFSEDYASFRSVDGTTTVSFER